MNPLRVALALPLALALVTTTSPSRADLPDLPDEAFTNACDNARRVESCPECTCTPMTSTSPIGDGATSPARYAVALEVKGEDAQGHTVGYAHVALGTAAGLVDAGRVAASMSDFSSDIDASVGVNPGEQYFDRCEDEGDCKGVGLVHVFEVFELVHTSAIDLDTDTTRETSSLAVCFAPGVLREAACYLVPVAWKETVTTVPGGPHQPPRPKSKQGWKRTWKVVAKGGLHLELGPVKGKGEKLPEKKGAAKVKIRDLAGFPGVERAER